MTLTFSMSSLHKLEHAGINVVTSLEKIHAQVMTAAAINLDEYNQYLSNSECLEIVIRGWKPENSRLPPNCKY